MPPLREETILRIAVLIKPGSSLREAEPFLRPEGLIPQNHLEAGLDAALVFGGDGTIHRYLPELHRHGIPVLVVPVGSGNDFARSLGIRSRGIALTAWRRYCADRGNIREIDLGVITDSVAPVAVSPGAGAAKLETGRQTLFCCVAGVGLDAGANARANRMPAWLRGTAGYVMAGLRELAAFDPVEFRLTTDTGSLQRKGFLAAVGNAHSYGGGMKVTPGATLDDGLLDVCLVGEMSKLKVLFCLPTIFFGAHTSIRGVEYFQAHRVRVETGRPLELYADGEPAGQTPLDIGLIRSGLKVIVPS
jgi:diacylglycerol kinase (ATP)